MTAGLYAVSLAGVASLQTSGARLAADRAPAVDAVARLRQSHDALESRLAQLDGASRPRPTGTRPSRPGSTATRTP